MIRTCPERAPLRGKFSWWAVWWATISCGSERTQLLVSTPLVSGVDPFTLFYYIRLAKRMFFDRPRTWILYEPMDRDKSLLLAMTSSFITSSFPYPSPLFDLTHQMALSSYLEVRSLTRFKERVGHSPWRLKTSDLGLTGPLQETPASNAPVSRTL